MLSRRLAIADIDDVQWKRLTDGAHGHEMRARRVVCLHRGGKPVACYDSQAGPLPLPEGPVADAQALAEALKAAHPEACEALVADPEVLRRLLAACQADPKLDGGFVAFLRGVHEARLQDPAIGLAPRREFQWYGLPMDRIRKFVDEFVPASALFVLGVFEGEALWGCLMLEFENGKVVALRGTHALPQDEMAQLRGIETAPFLLALAGNTLKRPAFGWFVGRADYEAWMAAPDAGAKAELFQAALADKRAVFDISVLVPGGDQAHQG